LKVIAPTYRQTHTRSIALHDHESDAKKPSNLQV